MSEERETTSAEVLAAFRRECIDGGIPADLADDLVRDAARREFDLCGVVVRRG